MDEIGGAMDLIFEATGVSALEFRLIAYRYPNADQVAALSTHPADEIKAVSEWPAT